MIQYTGQITLPSNIFEVLDAIFQALIESILSAIYFMYFTADVYHFMSYGHDFIKLKVIFGQILKFLLLEKVVVTLTEY